MLAHGGSLGCKLTLRNSIKTLFIAVWLYAKTITERSKFHAALKIKKKRQEAKKITNYMADCLILRPVLHFWLNIPYQFTIILINKIFFIKKMFRLLQYRIVLVEFILLTMYDFCVWFYSIVFWIYKKHRFI